MSPSPTLACAFWYLVFSESVKKRKEGMDRDKNGMIRDWISGLNFFSPLSFHPGAAAKGNFLSLIPMCETESLDNTGLVSSLSFSSLNGCRH